LELTKLLYLPAQNRMKVELKDNIYRLVIAFFLCIAMPTAQAQFFFDNFEDGDLTNNPEWNGNLNVFTINSDNELQLNDSEEGLSYISTDVGEIFFGDIEWRFYIKQSFSSSANNNSRVYLSSSESDISYTGTGVPNLEGYFLQFGEGGSDDAIELFRNDASGTSESIARGTEGFIASSFEMTVKIVRVEGGEWQIWADSNAGEDFTLQATGTDDAYSTVASLGWVCKYTSSNADNCYLDDFYIGNPIVDTESPLVTSVEVASQNELSVLFNEPVEQSSAENLLNYSASGIGNPTAAVLENSTEVLLTFGQNFISETEYVLSIESVQDLNENPLVLADFPFMYVEISQPIPGDLIINEIFADPSPEIGLPDAEWIEIYNTSANSFDLAQLEYFNTNTINPIESQIIGPGEYIVLSNSAGASSLSSFGTTATASTFTALTNTGDSLTLSYDGTVIDAVVYEDEWYQDDEKDDGGWSLERINPLAICSGADNWIASSSAIGGTPGAQNSEFSNLEDTNPPSVESVSLISPTLIFIQASEILNSDVASVAISLDNGITIAMQTLTGSSTGILVSLDSSVTIGEPFTVSVEGLSDCEGNFNAALQQFEVLSGFPAEAGDVLMTEIMADPSPQVGLPEVEYIELYNRTENYLDISDLDLDGATFENQVILAPLEYRVIMSVDDIPGNFIFAGAAGMEGWSSSFLTNSGKELILLSNDQVLDELIYDSTWYGDSDKDDGGWSLERINLEDPCSDGTNWSASESVFGGSPAEQNSVFNNSADETMPVVNYGYESMGDVYLIFNEPLNSSSVNLEAFLIDGLEPLTASTIDDYTVVLTLASAVESGQILTIQINGITDCWGNAIINSEVEVGLAEDADSGDIIINEILSNPVGSGSDYVEIYNHSSKVISLQGWLLAKRDDEGSLDQEGEISTIPLTILPGDYLLLTENVQSVLENYPNAVEENMWVMDLPSFSNDEGDVVLIMPNSEISDELYYSSDYHFGLLDDTDGVSLERVSFDVSAEQADNWSSAAASENYGTPGYVNSQSQSLQGASGTVNIYPEVFAPEGGFLSENNLEISYEFPFGDASASVQIFDKQGVLVRTLINNILIGPEGTFFWDGLDENSQKLPVGIYVIYFQVFTLNGDVESYKVPAVIAQI